MKLKALIIIFLALLLIGLAYVKSLLSHQDKNSAFPAEATQMIPEDILDDYIKKDAAAKALDSLQQVYSDSLTKLTGAQPAVDSQSMAAADSLESLISKLRKEHDQAKKEAKTAKQNKTRQFEKLVAAFYRGEISQLPGDLSDYEREVSIKEIKKKAMKYFDLSEKSLKRIVAKYK